jgi:hypothetical protein
MAVVSEINLYADLQQSFLSNNLPQWFGVEYMCDARNWTQHNVMSLPDGAELALLAHEAQQATLFQAVRHALVVYSLIVVFPLPISSAPFAELATILGPLVCQLLEFDRAASSPSLLLWISSMAALAAIDTPVRASLVASTARLCRELGVSTWEDMQSMLEKYVWSQDISEFDGMSLFLDIQAQSWDSDAGL